MAITYDKYQKSMIESFQKSIQPEKEFLNKYKAVFNAEIHSSMQLVYHRLMDIGNGLVKTITDLSSNTFTNDKNKPTDIKGTVSVLQSIENELKKYLSYVINYNIQYPNKVKRVLPTVQNRNSTDISESRLSQYKPVKQTGTLSTQNNVNTPIQDQKQISNRAIPLTTNNSISSGIDRGSVYLGSKIDRLSNILKGNYDKSAETLSDMVSDNEYKNQQLLNKKDGKVITPNLKKDETEKAGGKGFIGTLIGAIMSPLLAITKPLAGIIPGFLRMFGLRGAASLVGRIPGLGILTTGTAAVIAIDYLNKHPEAVDTIIETIGDVTKFAVNTIGKLLGENLPQTAGTVGKLIVGTVSTVYTGFVESIKESLTKGDYMKGVAQFGLAGTLFFLLAKKLTKVLASATRVIQMIPMFKPPTTNGQMPLDYGGLVQPGMPIGGKTPTKGFKGAVKNIGKKVLNPKNIGRAVNLASGLAFLGGDIALSYADESLGIGGEDRYKQTSKAKQSAVGLSDTASGALVGASIGSMIPVVGTAMGALIGASYGLSKALYNTNKEVTTSNESIQSEYEERMKSTNFFKDENEIRRKALSLAELIDSETSTGAGKTETATYVKMFADAAQNLDKARSGGDIKQIESAEKMMVLTSNILKKDNADVWRNQTKILETVGTKDVNLLYNFIKVAEQKADKKDQTDLQLKKEKFEYLKRLGFRDASKMSGYDEMDPTTSFAQHKAKGGSVQDGLFTVGENGMEMGYKRGNNVEIFPKADSNLKGIVNKDMTDSANSVAIPLAKSVNDSMSVGMDKISSIFQNTLQPLLTQMSEMVSNKGNGSDMATNNNQMNQNVVNNFANNNSVSSNGVDAYGKLQKFMPRFA